ncbi:MAG: type II toxin-antitoxin system VapC family toxin [Nitrospiraceae bacterium]
MAIPVIGKVVLDTNVFIDYLRTGDRADWVLGTHGQMIRFLSAVVLMELRIGADTTKRKRSIDRIQAAFPPDRLLAPTPQLFNRAGELFRRLYKGGTGVSDRLAPINDLLIALTAWHIGGAVVTGNLFEFRRIAAHLPGLSVVPSDW